MVNTINPDDWPVLFEDTFETLNVEGNGFTGDLTGKWMTGLDYNGDYGSAAPFGGTPHLATPPRVYTDADGLVMEMRKNTPQNTWTGLTLQAVNENKQGFTQNQGYWEWDARLPSGSGVWAGLWGLHADRDSVENVEVDIEYYPERHPRGKSFDNGLILHAGPASGSSPGWARSKTNIDIADTRDNWHTYGFYWDADKCIWFRDRQEIHRETDRMDLLDKPFYPIMTLTIENINSNFTQADFDALPSPQKMHIRRFTAYDLPAELVQTVTGSITINGEEIEVTTDATITFGDKPE